ncbi:MAG TPA: TonB-dependent receptor [Chitinophagaceae bacterium]|nr:TonB-dependent receptor [Chitinophagaceae bacterium]
MKKLCINIAGIACLIVLLSTQILFAGDRNSLRGTIYDAATHQPLVGATLYIPELKTGTVSGKSGSFTLKNIPAGSYLIQVRYVGYKTLLETVKVKGDSQHDFLLSTSVMEQNEVVVTGMSAATETKRSPMPIQSITALQLQHKAYTNIIDAIAKEPGVSQITTGPAISKPVIRGLGYNRVVVVNDGIRQEGQQWGDEHGIEIDDYNVNKVEILKGPASLMYGSDALAGVINIISNEPAPEGTVKGNIQTNYQTNSGLFGVHGSLKGTLNGFSWNAYGTRELSHDYQNKYDGYVFNSKFKETNFGGMIGLNKSWGYSRLEFAAYHLNTGMVEGDRDSLGRFTKGVNVDGHQAAIAATRQDDLSYQPFIPRQHIAHNKLIWDNSVFLNNNSRLTLTLGLQQSLRREFGEVLEPDVPGLFLQLNTLNYDAKYFLPAWRGWQTTAGVGGMVQQNLNKGNEFLIPDYHLFDVGTFLYTKKDFKRLTLSGGVRFDNRSLDAKGLYLDNEGKPVQGGTSSATEKFTPFDRDFSSFSGSAGLSYQASPRVTLKFNLAHGFRAPNIAELSANGVHEGTVEYLYGSNTLTPEASTEADAGAEVNTSHVSLSASLYYNYIHNYIFYRKLTGANGKDSIPQTGNPVGYPGYEYNQQNAFLYGGEFTIDIHPHPLDWLHFENTFSYVRGAFIKGTDSTKNLPLMPAPRWQITLRGNFKKVNSFLRNAYASITLDNYFDQDQIFSAYRTETTSPGYSLLNASLGTDIVNRNGKTLFSVFLEATNLTNIAYQNHLNRLRYAPENPVTGRMGVFNMGRNFNIKVSVPLDIKG